MSITAWQVPSYKLQFWLGRKYPCCVIIPVINEGSRIKTLLQRMFDLKIYQLADIIIVDGGSSDGSLDSSLLQQNAVKGLILKTGNGKLSAQLRCAYAFALEQGYEGFVTIDGNNKDDPEAIPAFIQALNNKVDFVQGSRFIDGGTGINTPKSREFAIRYIHAPLLRWTSGFQWTDTTQGFRAYSKKMLLDPGISPFRHVFQTYELLAYMSYQAPRLGFQCLELPTTRHYPSTGKIPSKITSFRGNLFLFYILIKACSGKYNP